MIQPVQTTFRHVHHSDAVAVRVQAEAARLATLFDRIVRCRVIIDAPHHHHRKGSPYHIRIEVGLPRKELVVDHEPAMHGHGSASTSGPAHKGAAEHARHEDIYVAISDAFKAMRRQLSDYARSLHHGRKLATPR